MACGAGVGATGPQPNGRFLHPNPDQGQSHFHPPRD
jgi:hypothetical protein